MESTSLLHNDEDGRPFKGVRHSGRSCRDLLCTILFLACVGVSISLSAVGFAKGKPSLLVPSSYFNDGVLTAEQKAQFWFHDAVAQTKTDAAVIGGMALLAVGLALLWVQLLKKFVRPFIFVTAGLGVLCVAALGAGAIAVSHRAPEDAWLLWVGVALLVLALVLALAVAFLRKHINLTAVLFEESCRGIQQTPTVFLAALIAILAFTAYLVFWAYSFVYLYAVPADTVSTDDVPTKEKLPEFNTSLRNALYFQVFMLLWISAVLSAAFQVAVGGAVSAWYFSRDAGGMDERCAHAPGGAALLSLVRAVTLSLGSIAFGSLILASVQFVNFMVKIARKKAQGSGNVVARYCLGCISGCLGCVANLVKFINRYAYIHIAMHGTSFLGAARDVFELLSRRGLEAVVVHTLGDLVLFLGKMMGVGLVTLIGVLALGEDVAPTSVALIAFTAFFLFNFFARVISASVDTVFVCYAEDIDRNGGADGHGGNLYCDPSVHAALQDKVRAEGPMN